jgi:hypothetical protein
MAGLAPAALQQSSLEPKPGRYYIDFICALNASGPGPFTGGPAMIIYVNESGSDRQELTEELMKEGVSFKESSGQTTRESSASGWRTVAVEANLPEVMPIPPEFAQSDGDIRAWRLPSGRMILTDLAGNLERIADPTPAHRR